MLPNDRYSFLYALFFTVEIELVVAVLLLKKWSVLIKKWKKFLSIVVAANLISLPLLWIILLGVIAKIFTLTPASILVATISAEAFPIAFEAYFIYWLNRKGITLRRAFILSIVINAATFLFGILLSNLDTFKYLLCAPYAMKKVLILLGIIGLIFLLGCTSNQPLDQKSTADCVSQGESLGAVVPGNNKECCPGLKPNIPEGLIGTRGTCEKE